MRQSSLVDNAIRQLQIEAERGDRAAELLKNPLFKEVLDKYEAALTEALIDAPTRDTEGIMAAKQLVQMCRRLRSDLEKLITTGRIATTQMREDRTISNRIAEMFNR